LLRYCRGKEEKIVWALFCKNEKNTIVSKFPQIELLENWELQVTTRRPLENGVAVVQTPEIL
jgi:hypothetical protein